MQSGEGARGLGRRVLPEHLARSPQHCFVLGGCGRWGYRGYSQRQPDVSLVRAGRARTRAVAPGAVTGAAWWVGALALAAHARMF